MTARILSVSVMLTAAIGLGFSAGADAKPASQKPVAAKTPACVCAPAPAPRAIHRGMDRAARSQAYAERFYNYWQGRPVLMTGWHGEWQQAPNDWVAPAAYAGGYEGGYEQGAYAPPEGGYAEEPGLAIDRNGWSGGVGGYGEGGGGGGGGVGLAIIAQGGRGLNGPTYNDYSQSFQNNPSQAGPFRNRLMGGFAPPPKSGGGK